MQRAGRAERVKGHLQIPPPACDRPAAFVVDDPPAFARPIDAVDDAVELPSVDGDVEGLLEIRGNRIEPASHAIRLELRDPVAFESGRSPRVRKRGGVPDLLMNRLQAPCADRPALLAQLARATQHLMKDDAVHRLCALHDRQPLDVAIPVLPWAILVRTDRAVRKVDVPAVTIDDGRRRRRCSRSDLGLDHDARPRLSHLVEEAAFPPATPSFVMRCTSEIEATARARHRHVEKAPLFRDHILPAADERLEHCRRQLEPRRT